MTVFGPAKPGNPQGSQQLWDIIRQGYYSSSVQSSPTCRHLGGVALAYAASRALQHTLLGEDFLLFRLRVRPSLNMVPLLVLLGEEALPGLVRPSEPAGLRP